LFAFYVEVERKGRAVGVEGESKGSGNCEEEADGYYSGVDARIGHEI
jgi:hypothetical protein